LIVLILYLCTLIPGLALGNSAEFQVLSYTPGMRHSTGYLVYLLVGKVFSLIPMKDIAYGINMLSVICAAGAVSLVCLAARLLGTGKLAG